ncbi:hypothetical protein, partial [Candidatus Enterovibrio escicola]|uniref:hypothetical protein n=1 Tax=Candidatus Enterovibrio escicola TaxID=1927127 RepID=UPI00167FEF83
VYREESILSHIVSTDKNIQRSDIELIVSSGLTISFIDIINSVKANISPDILDYLMSNYTDDLNELWFEDYSYNSLATLAVKENNISIFRVIQRHGVTLQTKENDKTALDFLAIPNNESDRQAAQEILSILAIANIRPYQIDKIQEIKSWLPSNILKTHTSYFSDVESYINQKINSTSDIEDDMYEELKPHLQTLSHKIAQIKNTIKNCSISIHEPTSDTETTSNLHKESSTSESEQLSANQKSQLIDMQIMLSEKKWEHYIDSLESFINEYNMPEYRSFALPILIQNSGPPHVLKEVIENGNVIVFPETITLAILKNDVESLKLILPLSHNIKLTEINQFLESNGSSEAVSDEIKNLFEQRKLKMGTE